MRRRSGDVEEEEKPQDWAEEVEKKKATKKLAKEKVCKTAGCKNPIKAPLGCAKCKTLGIFY